MQILNTFRVQNIIKNIFRIEKTAFIQKYKSRQFIKNETNFM